MYKNLKYIFGIIVALNIFVSCSNSSKNTGTIFKPSVQKPQHIEGRYELDYSFFKKNDLPIPNNYRSGVVDYLLLGNDVHKSYRDEFFEELNEDEVLAFFKDTKIKGYGDNSSYWRWKLSFTEDEFNNSVKYNLPMVYKTRPADVLTLVGDQWKKVPINSNSIGEIKDVQVAGRGRSGVITYLLITTTKNKYLVAKELNVRKLLTADKNSIKSGRVIGLYGAKGGEDYRTTPLRKNISLLPSAYFAIEKSWGKVTLYGGGNGHGVGMPQWTAYDLTKNYDYDYKDVLNRYYPNTKIKNMYGIRGVEKNIRVGITNSGGGLDHTKVVIYSGGKMKIYGTGFKINVPINQKVEIVNIGDKLSIKVNGKQRVKTSNSIKFIGNGYYIRIVGLRRAHTTTPMYRGVIEVKPSRTSSRGMRVINEVYIEDYLKQVVPSEMPQSFGVEALKAQAVAARTYALSDYLKFRYKKEGFHVKDTTESQVYNNQKENEDANRAIEATKGKVMIYKDKPVDAKYFSTSGGYMESANYIW